MTAQPDPRAPPTIIDPPSLRVPVDAYTRFLEEANAELHDLLRFWQALFFVMAGCAVAGFGVALWALVGRS